MDKNAKPHKIGYFPHADTGCLWYRIKTPMEALRRAGFDVEGIRWEEKFDFENFQSFQMYGIHGVSVKQVPEFIRRQGKKVVFDIDDAVNHIQPDNIHYHSVKSSDYTVYELMEACNEITVTTELLKKNYEEKTKTPITVLPNFYNPAEWQMRPKKQKQLRIGFAGGPSHIPDLNIILPVIAKLQEKYDFAFVLYGLGSSFDYQDSFKTMEPRATDELRAAMVEMDKHLMGMKFEWIPYGAWQDHPKMLASLDLDVGLCPLLDTPFNRCKSAIKAMEYNLVGTTAVATNLPPFSEEPTSILVSNEKWTEALEDLIKYGKRPGVEISQKLHLKWIKENRNVDDPKNIELLKKVYVV